MAIAEIESKPKESDTTNTYPNYSVILINDEVNSFQHVIGCLLRYIPDMTNERAAALAMQVHESGEGLVGTWPQEIAEMYYEHLKREKLTVKLEKQ